MDEIDTTALGKLLAPFLAVAVVVAVIATLLILRWTPVGGRVSQINAVTFDVVKFTNSQRAIASSFLKPNADPSQANELLLNLSERTRKAIQTVAGPNTIVMLKQAVVQADAKDITDDVLKELGLPTDVPTSDAARYSLDVAPTMMMATVPQRKPNPLPSETKDASGKVLP